MMTGSIEKIPRPHGIFSSGLTASILSLKTKEK